MKSKIQKIGGSLYARVNKEFAVDQEVLIIPYESQKDSNKCQYDIGEIKEAVAQAIEESKK